MASDKKKNVPGKDAFKVKEASGTTYGGVPYVDIPCDSAMFHADKSLNTLSETAANSRYVDLRLSIAKEFTPMPGGRYKKEGSYSGEEFRETVLLPKFLEAANNGVKLIVDLDGCMGYPSSFLDESFGGLARKFSSKKVKEILVFKSDEQPSLIQIIYDMIEAKR